MKTCRPAASAKATFERSRSHDATRHKQTGTPDFVVVGHVTTDRLPDGGWRPGGAALYAAVTAAQLGLHVGLLTRAFADSSLGNLPRSVEVIRLPSAHSTEFVNTYSQQSRTQIVTAVAGGIGPSDVPVSFKSAALVLLAPVIGEIRQGTRETFKGTVGLGAQGWLRALVGQRVRYKPWSPDETLAGTSVVFASTEDAPHTAWPALLKHWLSQVPVVCVSDGERGGTVFAGNEEARWPAYEARVVDPTGAGDVFAAAFLARYAETSDRYEAASFAAAAAACAVEAPGTAGIADRVAVERRREVANG